jgi:hypothetical protein
MRLSLCNEEIVRHKVNLPRIFALLLVTLLAATSITAQPVQANTQAGIPILFPETGHTLGYSFRQFYDSQGGVAIFGLPLTEVFIEDGLPVQYFERARFEWHATVGQVQAGHLGRWAAQNRMHLPAFAPQAQPSAEGAFFPETGHSLKGAFLSFWQQNGGLETFGYPLSEEFAETNDQDGQSYTVQYFERARFELRPDGSVALGLVADDLAPCQQKVRRPQGLPPSGPGLEGDPRSCDQPDKIAMGRVFPATGLPGGRYGFEAINYRPGEEVKLWINNPDGSVRRLNYGAIADSNGYVIIAFDTEPDDDLGNYSLVGQGERSRRLVLAPFRLAR